jgi:hypothetical protein
LQSITEGHVQIRTSLYADDAALFLRPSFQDLVNIQVILQQFGSASSLSVKFQKLALYMIRSDASPQSLWNRHFRGTVASLPATYRSLPLRLHSPTRGDEQQLVDKIAGHLASWKGKLLNRAGRLALVNAVLSNMSVYYMTSNSLSNWAVSKIEKIRQNFLYKGDDLETRLHCPVN